MDRSSMEVPLQSGFEKRPGPVPAQGLTRGWGFAALQNPAVMRCNTSLADFGERRRTGAFPIKDPSPLLRITGVASISATICELDLRR